MGLLAVAGSPVEQAGKRTENVRSERLYGRLSTQFGDTFGFR